ncbi:MAG: PQQ-binding-like beta-propeller repeat protein, partial [Planctomycetes bacterium]|nr:PQQ-binding-like beta-propeller repeat protein [Planctomycetota bacterium]
MPRSAPTERLLRVGSEAIARGDWKLAIDSLQRILDDTNSSTLVPDAQSKIAALSGATGGLPTGASGATVPGAPGSTSTEALVDQPPVFRSAQDVAERILATMPEDGLRAYRILYDGQAKAAYHRAVDEHDGRALTTLARRFLLSSWGDDAAVLAAAWALDAGRSAEALSLLDRVESRCRTIDTTTYPSGATGGSSPSGATGGSPTSAGAPVDTTTPTWRRSLLRAVALAHSGDTAGAQALLTDLIATAGAGSDTGGSRPVGTSGTRFAFTIRATETWISARRRPGRPDDRNSWTLDGASWPTRGGGADRSGIMSAVLAPQLQQSQSFDLSNRPLIHLGFGDRTARHAHRSRIPALHPCVEGGRLYVKSDAALVALDLETLSPIWSVPRGSDVQGRLEEWARARTASLYQRMFPSQPGDDAELTTDYVTAALSVYHGQVYSIERSGIGRDLAAGEVHDSVRPNIPTIDSGAVHGTRLIAYRAETGTIVWQRGRTGDAADPLGRVEFLAPPILVAGLLWTPILDLGGSAGARNELSMVALDPRSGQQIQRVMLCSLSRTTGSRPSALYPAAAEHTLYIPTGHGLLLAMDAEQGVVRWASRYDSHPSTASNVRRPRSSLGPGQWLCSPPVVCGGAVVLAPVDGRQVMAFDRSDGHRLWSVEAPIESEYILAGTADTVILGGEVIEALDATSGAVRWTTRIPPPTGRGALSGARIYLPTLDGLVVIDSAS